jgi:hypothetical protein
MTAVNPDTSRQAVVEAALVLLERMGLTPADLTAVPQHRTPAPTFAEYVPTSRDNPAIGITPRLALARSGRPGSAAARISRTSVERLTAQASLPVSRAPARPPRASATACSTDCRWQVCRP